MAVAVVDMAVAVAQAVVLLDIIFIKMEAT
jgi:hypothetical protein